MLVALLWTALAMCFAATIAASIKLWLLRKAAASKTGWHTQRVARLWTWAGNAGLIASAGVFVASFPLGQTALGLSAFIGSIVLIYVFVSAAKEAAGEGEGAN